MPCAVAPLRYLKMCFTVFQYTWPGLFENQLTRLTEKYTDERCGGGKKQSCNNLSVRDSFFF